MPFSLNTPCSLFLALQLHTLLLTIVPQLTDLFLSGLYYISHLCTSFWIVFIPMSSDSLTFFFCLQCLMLFTSSSRFLILDIIFVVSVCFETILHVPLLSCSWFCKLVDHMEHINNACFNV